MSHGNVIHKSDCYQELRNSQSLIAAASVEGLPKIRKYLEINAMQDFEVEGTNECSY